jgi:hypothetical protein
MIELTLLEVYAARDVLNKLVGMDFSIRTSFLISKMAKAANVELMECESKKRALFVKYGIQDEKNRNIWRVKPENQGEVNRQVKELLDVEVTLLCDPIKLSVLDAERIQVPENFLPLLFEVRESKRSPEDALRELKGKMLSLTPIEVARIEKFVVQD